MSSAPGADAAPGSNPATPTPAATARRHTFSSLKVRNYRLFATGALVSNIGTWMSRIAQDWLVLSITGSSAAVGITTALQFLPMLLFGLYGGVIADRYAKRPLLMITQASMGLLGLALAALTLSGHVQVWHVYAIAFLLGVVTVVDNPTRQSFVVEMVGPRDVRNAVSLNSANFQTARLVGPAVAGVLITAVGSGWAFLINGLSFGAPLVGLLLMRPDELHQVERTPRGKGQLREGLRYVAGQPELIWPIVLVGFIGTFGFNFPIWLSAFANKVFDSGAGTYGLLNTLMAEKLLDATNAKIAHVAGTPAEFALRATASQVANALGHDRYSKQRRAAARVPVDGAAVDIGQAERSGNVFTERSRDTRRRPRSRGRPGESHWHAPGAAPPPLARCRWRAAGWWSR